MTHDTDAERQAFEAWLGIKPCGAAHDLAWSAWKAARRAPAAPVPQEVARLRNAISRCADFIEHAPVSSGVCCCGDSMEGHADPMVSGHVAVDEWDWSASCMVQELRAIIAAAPQPPEAAPVELPEPFTTLVRKNSWDKNSYDAAPRSYRQDYGRQWADERINVFTEQQVRDLLAAAKVERKPLTADEIKEPKNGDNWRVEWWNESCRLMLPADKALDSFMSYKNGTMQFTLKQRAHGIGKDKA